MSYIFKFFLTLNSLLLIFSVYLVKNNIFLNILSTWIPNDSLGDIICKLPYYISYLAYFMIVVLFTYISLLLIRFLSHDQISAGAITTVETANDSFLPSYLGYFFVALSISDINVFSYVFSIIFIFILFSKISYFNPIFLLFGYNFFHLTQKNGLKIVVITKKELKTPSEVGFFDLKRINNYTFISTEP